jgi:alpha,alpha-trehalose phosphorylase
MSAPSAPAGGSTGDGGAGTHGVGDDGPTASGHFGEAATSRTAVGAPPVYPIEGWHVRETDFALDSLPQSETIFSLSNGYLGLRGNLEEGAPAFERGTYLNGFYESRPIVYPEAAYGYAQDDQAMLNVTDGKMISLKVDGEPFDVRTGELIEHNRVLDLRRGFVGREVVWESPSGRRISVRTRRLVSLTVAHLACMEYEVEALGPETASPMTIEITSQLVANESDLRQSEDPREMAAFWGQVLKPVWGFADGERIGLGHRVERAGLAVFCLTDHVLDVPGEHEATTTRDDDSRIDRTYTFELHSGQVSHLRKYLVYTYGPDDERDAMPDRVAAWMDEAKQSTFSDLLDAQVNRLDEFWRECHIDIVGDDSLRQAVRFALFQVLQASALTGSRGIPAKGLTGQGYNGHYFWDMETYVLHVLTYLAPSQALQCLRYRHSTLPRARQRAAELSKRGALFPWRTIDGEEASSFFPAGTAEYHINGDIAHAIRHYCEISGDDEFLFDEGIEVLAETARFWMSLGFYNPGRDGRFCINEVTGPDEYTALVDNNTFTNLMAKSNLAYAADVVERMQAEAPDAHRALVGRVGLGDDEPAAWRAAAEAMYVHYDDDRGLHGQDDSFLDKQPWDFAGTPPDRYPLLLHYHPLDLYRSQVIKQADLVMAMFLHGREFDDDAKARNFAYYDPITTADSSLSMCIQAILAAEVGDLDKAWQYTQRTALTDLHNVQHNVHDGIHIASQAGTWLALVCGFGGLRNHDGVLHFRPQLPPDLEALGFRCRADGAVVEVLLSTHWVTYSLVSGTRVQIVHNGEELALQAGEPVHINW